MTSAVMAASIVASKAAGFIKRQRRDLKVIITRQAVHTFLYQMTVPYLSLYIVALGASTEQLGIMNSAGLGIASVFSFIAGWLVDRYGVKRIYLTSIAVLCLSSLVYAIAWGWVVAAIAVVLFYIGFRMGGTSCGVVCAASLTNEDRATGMNLCGAVGSSMALISPLLGAVLVVAFGGINARGIAPLFFISAAGYGALVLFVGRFLTGTSGRKPETAGPGFRTNVTDVFRESSHLGRWLAISGLSYMQFSLLPIFVPLYAHDIKGAEASVLGGMATGAALTGILLGIPAGRLADRMGRKRMVFLLSPMYYISMLLLIIAPSPVVLIGAGVLQGFFVIAMTVADSMGMELVPLHHMGRWMGMLGFFRSLISAPAPFLAGVIWGFAHPEYIFIAMVIADLSIRMPLLWTMPETLGRRRPDLQMAKS